MAQPDGGAPATEAGAARCEGCTGPGQACCDDLCVDTLVDHEHCGGCGRACPTDQSCQQGTCQPLPDCRVAPCPRGFYCDLNAGICHAGCTGQGQCFDHEICDTANRTCVCEAGFHRCASKCVASSAPEHCGDRCAPCPTDPLGAPTCTAGQCGLTCDAGARLCEGACRPCPAGGSSHFLCAGPTCMRGFVVGGTVEGLGGTVVLKNGSHGETSVSASGVFSFADPLQSGEGYEVSVKTQPTTQTCVVTNGTGTLSDADVTDIVVTCTDGDGYEPDDDVPSAKDLVVDAPAQVRNISSAADVDWISFNITDLTRKYLVKIPSCTKPVIAAFLEPDSRAPSGVVPLFRSDGTRVVSAPAAQGCGAVTQIFSRTGIHYLLVYPQTPGDTGAYTIELDDGGPVKGVELTIRITSAQFKTSGVNKSLDVKWAVTNNGDTAFDGCFVVGAQDKIYTSAASISFYPDKYAKGLRCAKIEPGKSFADYNYFSTSDPYTGTAFVYVDLDNGVAEADETNNLSTGRTWCSYPGTDGKCN